MRVAGYLQAFLGTLPRTLVRREARQLLRRSRDCRTAQQNVLKELLALNADSRFSREHGLDHIHTPAEFRRALPICNYDTFREDIDRECRGEKQSLLGSDNRLLMFSLTSGTTSAAKYIPITERFLKDYRRGWQTWGIQVLDDHPAISLGHIIQLTSHFDQFRTPGGTPCGNISGLAAAMQKKIIQFMYSVPAAVARIEDPFARHYTAMRLAIADPYAALLTTANPSTLIHLSKLAHEHAESLIRDISMGTLAVADSVPADVQAALGRRLTRRNPARAQALCGILARTGTLFPKDYWPDMQLLAVWTGGSAGAYLSGLQEYFGEVPVRDHGLSASEGRMTIPLGNGTAAGILDVCTHYFEFIPVAEYESEHPTVLEAHELQEGDDYYILLTTSSGLCRYDICDVVRCTGFFGTTPLLEFLHKGAHISNLTGEKIAESQVVAAVRTVADRMRIRLSHFTVSPVWSEPPRYQLLVEGAEVISHAVGESLAEQVEFELQKLNCEYADKRASGRLQPLRWFPLPVGTWERYTAARQDGTGGSPEQYKHPCLVPDLTFCGRLLREHAIDANALKAG